MSVIIPIRPLAASNVPATRPSTGLFVPIGLGGTNTSAVQKREAEALKAVAAAAAVSSAGESLAVASDVQRGVQNPGTIFEGVNSADVRVVLDEVRRVQADRTGAPGPDETQRLVAAAVGADPVLVAAALAKMAGADAVAAAARSWAAAADAALLERAARAAARRKFLDPGQQVDDVTRLRQQVDNHEVRIHSLEGKEGGQAAGVRPRAKAAPGRRRGRP